MLQLVGILDRVSSLYVNIFKCNGFRKHFSSVCFALYLRKKNISSRIPATMPSQRFLDSVKAGFGKLDWMPDSQFVMFMRNRHTPTRARDESYCSECGLPRPSRECEFYYWRRIDKVKVYCLSCMETWSCSCHHGSLLCHLNFLLAPLVFHDFSISISNTVLLIVTLVLISDIKLVLH